MAKQSKSPGKQASFNTPFQALKRLKDHPETHAPSPPPPREREAAPVAAERSEEELFQEAMAGVSRLVDPRGSAPPPLPREPRVVTDDSEALARLAELVSGEGPFDFSDGDEYIEGAAPGVNRRLLSALRRGDFAVQGHIDLHGMSRADAKEAVDGFLTASRRAGKRCVLVIHGRGLNSKDHIPVLKEQLKVWLQRGRIGRSVLAFTTARPHDGGAGALYLLLRR
jgi:DNA-nicking Smr family endonuclease